MTQSEWQVLQTAAKIRAWCRGRHPLGLDAIFAGRRWDYACSWPDYVTPAEVRSGWSTGLRRRCGRFEIDHEAARLILAAMRKRLVKRKENA